MSQGEPQVPAATQPTTTTGSFTCWLQEKAAAQPSLHRRESWTSPLPMATPRLGTSGLDPDLGARLDDQNLEDARRLCVANVMQVEPGQWDPTPAIDSRDDVFALVIVDGILSRVTGMARHEALELLCPGDVLLPTSIKTTWR